MSMSFSPPCDVILGALTRLFKLGVRQATAAVLCQLHRSVFMQKVEGQRTLLLFGIFLWFRAKILKLYRVNGGALAVFSY